MSLNQLIRDQRKRWLSARVESLKVDNGIDITGDIDFTGDVTINGDLDVTGFISNERQAGPQTVYQNYQSGDNANDGLTSGTAIVTGKQ
jgi:hypothetical protein